MFLGHELCCDLALESAKDEGGQKGLVPLDSGRLLLQLGWLVGWLVDIMQIWMEKVGCLKNWKMV